MDFSPIRTGNELLDRIQDRIRLVFASLKPRFVLIQTAIATTDTTVFHNLGQAVSQWTIVDRDANATVYRSATAPKDPKTSIVLKASAPVNVTLRFE